MSENPAPYRCKHECERDALKDRIEALEAALRWYAEQAEGCRKITREGDEARQALDRDGGKRARSALSPSPKTGA